MPELMYNLDMSRAVHFSLYTMQRFRRIQSLLDQLDPEFASQALVVPGSAIPERKIIVFPGSYNPPTIAHLALLKQAWQFARVHGPMQIYAALSTHITDKERVQRPSLLDRINLLETVLHNHARSTGIMLFNRGLYVEQAEAVYRAFTQVTTLYFLVGFDKIVQVLDPHYYRDRDAALDELFKLADFLVAPRGEGGPKELHMLLDQPVNCRYAGHVHDFPIGAPYQNISSTRIREDIESYDMETPSEVRRFVRETHVYEPPLEQEDGSQIDQYGERIKVLETALKSMNVET